MSYRIGKKAKRIAAILGITLVGITAGMAQAGTTWTGGGADGSWGDANNWGGALPAFDGTETLTFGSGFASGTTLQLNGNRNFTKLDFTTGTDLTFEAGIAGSKMLLQQIESGSPVHYINNDITLTGNGSFTSNGSVSINFRVNGDIDDGGNGYSLTMTGPRYALLGGDNTFTGALNLQSNGRTYLSGTNTPSQTNISGNHYAYIYSTGSLGSNEINISGGGIRAQNNLTLTNDLNIGGDFDFGQSGGLGINFNTGTVTLNADAEIGIGVSNGEIINFQDGITDDGGARSLSFSGNRDVRIGGNSTYTGATILNGNEVRFSGTMTTSGLTVNGSSAILDLNADNPIGTGTLTINTGFLNAIGARRTLDNDMTWAGDWGIAVNGSGAIDFGGDVTMTSNVEIDQNGSAFVGSAPVFQGNISDGGNGYTLSLVGSVNRYYVLEGQASHTGGTTISDVNGDVTVVVQGAADRLPATGPVTVLGGATLQFNGGFEQTIGHLAGNGGISSGSSNIVLADGTGSWSGNIYSGGSLEVDGATQTITTGQGFSGGTTITSGTLIANNASGSATGSGPVTVNDGLLTGSGSIAGQVTVNGGTVTGNLTVDDNLIANAGGTLSPGNSPGQLVITGDLTMNADSVFEAELNNNFAITGYDVISVGGDVTLNDPILSTTIGFEPSVADKLFIIFNNGANAISGNFLDLPEGSIVELGEFNGAPIKATISYFGDSNTSSITGGNDVVLYNFSIPEPTTMSLLSFAGLMVLRRRRRA